MPLIERIDALYWRPPAGESIADVQLRMWNFFDTLQHECEGKRILVVTHGEFMSAARAGLESLSDEEWVNRDFYDEYKLHTTQMLHYSRIDPTTGDAGNYLSWLRNVCVDRGIDSGWRSLTQHRFSNQNLLEQVGLISRRSSHHLKKG